MDHPATPGRLLLARHGQTRWNVEQRRQGRADIPLDEVGHAQAAALCAALTSARIDAVFVSPLTRARQTAEAVARVRGLALEIDHDLIEFDYGEFGGSIRSHVKLRVRRDYLRRPVPGGESLADAWNRAERFCARVRPSLLDGAQILVVAHQRLNRLMLGVLEGCTLEETAEANEYRPETGSLLDVRFDVIDGMLRVVDHKIIECD